MRLLELLHDEALRGDALRVARRLPPPRPDSFVAFAFGDDRRAFAAALFGAWTAGHGAILPENALREFVVPVLARSEVVEFLHDTGAGRGVHVPTLLANAAAGGAAATGLPAPIAGGRTGLVTCTTLPDGGVAERRWTAPELLARVDALTAAADARLAELAGLLSPMFLPSLLLGLLVPMRRRERFRERRPADVAPREVAARTQPVLAPFAAELGAGGAVLPIDGIPEDELPRDQNGRIVRSSLFLRLGRGRDGAAVERELAWREVAPRAAGERRFATVIPQRYAFYEGHFTTYAVLAGAVQLHELVLPCVRRALPALGELLQLEGVKFAARIAPGDAVEVGFVPAVDGRRIVFEIWRGEVRATTGKLVFAEGA
ncbi:MAG: hypothetical protein U1E73_02685 [Planctomycetota bacterium]